MQYQSIPLSNTNKNIHNHTTDKYLEFIKNNNNIIQDITLSIENPSSNKENKQFDDFNTSNIIKTQIYQDEESKSYIKELLEICNCVKNQKKYNTPYRGLNRGDLLEITKKRKSFFIKNENKRCKIKRIHTADEKNLLKKYKSYKQNINNNNINNIEKVLSTKTENKLWTNMSNNRKKSIFTNVNNYKISQKTENLSKNYLKNKKNKNNKPITYNKNYNYDKLLYYSNKLNSKSSSKLINQHSSKNFTDKIKYQVKYSKSAVFYPKNVYNSYNSSKIKYFYGLNLNSKKESNPIKSQSEEQIILKNKNVCKKENKKKNNRNCFLKNSGFIKKISYIKSEKYISDSVRLKNSINLNNNNNYSLSSRKITNLPDNNDSNFENILGSKKSLNLNINNNRKAHIIEIKFLKRKKSINSYNNRFRKYLEDKRIFDLSGQEKMIPTSINPKLKTKKSRIISIYVDSKLMLFNKM